MNNSFLEQRTEEIAEVQHEFHALLVPVTAYLGLAFVALGIQAALESAKVTSLPSSGTTALLGLLFGVLLQAFDGWNIEAAMPFTFSYTVFSALLLPIIIFSGAIELRQKLFWRYLHRIVAHALIGTALSTVIVAAGIVGLSRAGAIEYYSIPEAAALGALLSATDPVAVLSAYSTVGIGASRLYALSFGESTLNDATAILIFRVASTMASARGSETHTERLATSLTLDFFVFGVGSIAYGIAVGALFSYMVKRMSFLAYGHIYLAMHLIVGIGTYMSADLLNMSGIIATLFAGLVIKQYAFFNFHTEQDRSLSLHSVEMMAHIADTAVFISLGVSLSTQRVFDGWLVLAAFILPAIGRAAQVSLITALANRWSGHAPVSVKEQTAMVHGGTRGAVSFSLVLTLPGSSALAVETAISAVLLVLTLSIFTNGGTTTLVLRTLGLLPKAHEHDGQDKDATVEGDAEDCTVCASLHSMHEISPDEVLAGRFDRMLRPYLTTWSYSDDYLHRGRTSETHPLPPPRDGTPPSEGTELDALAGGRGGERRSRKRRRRLKV